MTSHERVLSLILKGENRFSVFCLIVNCRATCQNQCFRSRKCTVGEGNLPFREVLRNAASGSDTIHGTPFFVVRVVRR